MQTLSAFFLLILFMVSLASQVFGWGGCNPFHPDVRVEWSAASSDDSDTVPDSSDESPDERTDEGTDWYGRAHQAHIPGNSNVWDVGYPGPSDDCSLAPDPSTMEPPPPEC